MVVRVEKSTSVIVNVGCISVLLTEVVDVVVGDAVGAA